MKIGYIMQTGVADIRNSPLSGPSSHVTHVIEELIKLGHHVLLLVRLNDKVWKSDKLEKLSPVSIPWLDHGAFRLFERVVRRIQFELRLPYLALFESLRFAFACRQELADCDLLYERMGWMGYGGALASRWMGIPLVLEVNGDHLSEMEMLGVAPRGLQRWLSTLITKNVIQQPSRVIATGEGWRQRFIERWNVQPEKVVVIENGSDVVQLLDREQLSSFSIGHSTTIPLTLIYIGAFEPWHGLLILIRALAKAIANGTKAQLILVGSGTELDNIQKLINELEMGPYITLTGSLTTNQFISYLTEAEIGVSPYCGRVEYSGLKLLDYKAAGLAIIASGEDGSPTILEHGRSGWIVPPCDVEALSAAIIELADNVELRRKIGQQARLEAEKYHSWRHTAEEIEKVFFQVFSSEPYKVA
jgi:glycosyltransferase involved in cell wall biosynthesis